MPELIKYSLEFPINSSVSILYKRLSTASGLAEWFADDVIVKNKIFTFFWEGSEQEAKLLKLKTDYFEMTSDVSLIITDFAEDEQDQEEQTSLWSNQISLLKMAIGS
jgi:hypothetical protein